MEQEKKKVYTSHYLLVFVCFMIFSNTLAQHPEAYKWFSLKASDAFGRVKTLESITYVRPCIDYAFPYTEYSSTFIFWAESKKEFNREGYYIKIGSRSAPEKNLSWSWVVYDSSGTILKYDYRLVGTDTIIINQPFWKTPNERWEADGMHISKYDTNGIELEYESKFVKGIHESYRHWIADEHGNLIKDEQGTSISLWQYDYDSLGRKISERKFYGNGELIDRYDYEYDKAGHIKKTIYDDGETGYTIDYTYDSHGNVLSEKMTHKKVNSNYLKTFKYTYDKKGNWIAKTEFLNGIDITKVSRKITYYTD